MTVWAIGTLGGWLYVAAASRRVVDAATGGGGRGFD